MQFSKEGQDLFANFFINDFRSKYFLDLGCSHPKNGNNTYMLENQGWSGLIVDNRPDLFDLYKQTNRNCICKLADLTDAIQLNDVCDTFIENFGNHIDYISFDVDAATIKVVENFPFEKLTFGIMTFEHDVYHLNSTNKKREAMLERLAPFSSYKRLVTDIGFKATLSGNTILRVHEDWWYNASKFDKSISFYCGNTVFWKDYLKNIEEIRTNSRSAHYIARLGGGIGDTINWFCKNEPSLMHVASVAENKILISCNSHNQFSTELFKLLPYQSKFIIFDPENEFNNEQEKEYFNKLTSDEKKAFRLELENRFIQKHQIKNVRNFVKVIDNNFYNLHPTSNDLNIINKIVADKRPFVVLAPGASTQRNTIPNCNLQFIVNNIDLSKYNVVMIGKTNSNIKFANHHSNVRCDDLHGVIDLIDQLTIHGTLKLIDYACGLVCSDSSMLCYGNITNKPMLVLIHSKTNKKYGFIDKSLREPYFNSFDRGNVVVAEYTELSQSHVANFIANTQLCSYMP